MNQGVNLPLTGGLPSVTEQNEWNAAANTPVLVSGVGQQGQMYRVSVAGTTVLDGVSNWSFDDWAVFLNGAWRRIAGGSASKNPYAMIGATTLQNLNTVGLTTVDFSTVLANTIPGLTVGPTGIVSAPAGEYRMAYSIAGVDTDNNRKTVGCSLLVDGATFGFKTVGWLYARNLVDAEAVMNCVYTADPTIVPPFSSVPRTWQIVTLRTGTAGGFNSTPGFNWWYIEKVG